MSSVSSLKDSSDVSFSVSSCVSSNGFYSILAFSFILYTRLFTIFFSFIICLDITFILIDDSISILIEGSFIISEIYFLKLSLNGFTRLDIIFVIYSVYSLLSIFCIFF